MALTTQLGAAIETAWLSYINRMVLGYTVPRYGYRSGAYVLGQRTIVVQAQSPKNDAEACENGPLFTCHVSLQAYTSAPDDENQTELNAIHAELEKLVANTTIAQLSAVIASGITVTGIERMEDLSVDGDQQQMMTVEILMYLNVDFAAFSTTTTTTTTTTTSTTT